MWLRPRRAGPTHLARIPLVLLPGGARRGGVAWGASIIVALLAGAAGGHFYGNPQSGHLQEQASMLKDMQQLRSDIEQSGLRLRVSDARGQELERQIDALNQRLRECQEEVTFFRKARNGKP